MAAPSQLPELLPCPFCGGRARLVTASRAYNFRTAIECESCGANTGPANPSTEYPAQECEVAQRWNRRDTPLPSTAAASPEYEVLISPQRRAEICALLDLPVGTNTEKLDDATLAILTLSIINDDVGNSPGIQVEPGIDQATLARLYRKGFLAAKPYPPVNAIWLTPAGLRRARELFRQCFCG